MKIKDILSPNYTLLTESFSLEIEIEGCYATDLLSQAIKSADENNILITIISHQTTVGVASMINLPAIIICESRPVSLDMIEKANEHHIAILKTPMKTYEVILDLFKRGIIS